MFRRVRFRSRRGPRRTPAGVAAPGLLRAGDARALQAAEHVMSWTGILALALLLAFLAPALVAWRFIRARNMQIWLPQWIFRKRLPKPSGTTHGLFCSVDHFEPMQDRKSVGEGMSVSDGVVFGGR